MCDGATAKKLLFVFNIVFWVSGAALLGFGLWMKFDPTIVHFLSVTNPSSAMPMLNYAAIIFVITGGVVLLIGVIGCCGAVRSSQSLLFIYALLVLCVMAAEIVAGALALTYRSKMEGKLSLVLLGQVKQEYYPAPPETENPIYDAYNYIQKNMQCCGSNNFTDYIGSKWWNGTSDMPPTRNSSVYVPVSCCNPDNVAQCQLDAKSYNTDSMYLYTEGCSEAIIGWFETHTLIMMILGFAIGGCQIFGFLTACCLRNALKANPNKYT